MASKSAVQAVDASANQGIRVVLSGRRVTGPALAADGSYSPQPVMLGSSVSRLALDPLARLYRIRDSEAATSP